MPPQFTPENLAALNAAIATGAREVWYGDKRVAYRSLEEMIQTRNMMLAELYPQNGPVQRGWPEFSKGL